MNVLRRLVLSHPALSGAVILLALMMKLLVPGGFMPNFDHGRMVISICTGTGPMTMVMAIPGVQGKQTGHGDQQKQDHPCAFSGLSAPSLAAADPLLLALAIAFIVALGYAPTRAPHPRRASYLRPPLRGPPAPLLTT